MVLKPMNWVFNYVYYCVFKNTHPKRYRAGFIVDGMKFTSAQNQRVFPPKLWFPISVFSCRVGCQQATVLL